MTLLRVGGVCGVSYAVIHDFIEGGGVCGVSYAVLMSMLTRRIRFVGYVRLCDFLIGHWLAGHSLSTTHFKFLLLWTIFTHIVWSIIRPGEYRIYLNIRKFICNVIFSAINNLKDIYIEFCETYNHIFEDQVGMNKLVII